jgi:hypothetical protein
MIGRHSRKSSGAASYEMVISSDNVDTYGKGASTGFMNPGGGSMYQYTNSSNWATISDQRLKKNIVDNTEGLDLINAIRVRNFEYRTAEEITEVEPSNVVGISGIQLGVIAQELEEVCPDCIKQESTGIKAVITDDLMWHMLNAIKELSAKNDALTARITALEGN